MLKKLIILYCSLTIIFLASSEVLLRYGIIENSYHNLLTWEAKPEPSKNRVLLIGDSFVHKYGDLSKSLTKGFIKNHAQFLNISFSGEGPHEYLLKAQKWIPKIKPKLVILSYYVGNDLTDSGRMKYKLVSSFFDRFYLYNYSIKNDLLRSEDEFPYEEWTKMGITQGTMKMALSGKINPWLIEAARMNPNYLLDNILMEGRGNQKLWERAKSSVNKIIKIAKDNGSKIAIVIFPRSVQINKELFPFFKSLQFKLSKDLLSSRRPQDKLLELCQVSKIQCLDLLPPFSLSNEKSLYLPTDDHLNKEGNLLASRLILDFYEKHLNK